MLSVRAAAILWSRRDTFRWVGFVVSVLAGAMCIALVGRVVGIIVGAVGCFLSELGPRWLCESRLTDAELLCIDAIVAARRGERERLSFAVSQYPGEFEKMSTILGYAPPRENTAA